MQAASKTVLIALLMMNGAISSSKAAETEPPEHGVFESLNRCAFSRKIEPCRLASEQLQAWIDQVQTVNHEALATRCLSALTKLHTDLSVFRWQLASVDPLKSAIATAEQQCSTEESSRFHE
jgi:hypothetical protein